MTQRRMWSTMVMMRPMVLEHTMRWLDILRNFNYMFTKYRVPNMVSTNIIGSRVTMVAIMCFCRYD